MLGDEDADVERAIDMEAVATHWDELPEREQKILTMRFYGNLTQAEIGATLGISQMHVSRLLTRRWPTSAAACSTRPPDARNDPTRKDNPP